MTTVTEMRNVIAIMRQNLGNFDDTQRAFVEGTLNTFAQAVDKLEAVPVDAIHSIWEELFYDDVGDNVKDDLDAVQKWLEKAQQ